MIKIKIKSILIVIFGLCIINIFTNTVNADMGDKPSITIKLKNMTTNNYLIDLLEYAESKEDYYPDSNFSTKERYKTKTGKVLEIADFNEIAKVRYITAKQAEELYNVNYDGWISSCTRESILWGSCSGNIENIHSFNYFGTPTVYKILIINNDTGEIKLSNIITREDFSSYVTFDVKTMKVTQKASIDFVKIVLALFITIIIEIIISIIMKLKGNIKLIVITNVVSNLTLQIILNMISTRNYMLVFIIMEIIVVIAEYLIYKKFMKEQSKKKILYYTIIANIITALLTFIIK